MKTINALITCSVLCATFIISNEAAAARKTPSPTPLEIYYVIIDRINEAITIEGLNLTNATYELGGATATLKSPPTTPNSDTHAEIRFDDSIASVVTSAGTYNLVANGNEQFPVFINAPIVSSTAIGCPCIPEWNKELADRQNLDDAGCLESGTEIAGNFNNTDTSGVIISTLTIGAVFDSANNPQTFSPVCSLTETSSILPVTLVTYPINATQQTECATHIKSIISSC